MDPNARLRRRFPERPPHDSAASKRESGSIISTLAPRVSPTLLRMSVKTKQSRPAPPRPVPPR